ncbi:NmrA family NAD(P)-binding protein [Sphingomonas sp. MMSM20]|uniref:NmrA family NAD(P)-binding protein n=1 Tax=Sphingomonas lycopersici TaxID=2951807 RepID=UPI0022386732|nr:NmrA family NAD(P)-binding protein [Sphingomonas lycopersici]MCW6532232.1 NmrA family NAD(P)-binding protein [Sphingomonas lycopersici]
MFVVMGANGHVGSAVARTLLGRDQKVIIVTHDETRGDRWRERGAEVAVADVSDPESLRRAFARGRRAFLLNPPADVKTDTDAVERAGVAGILAALDGSGLEKVVAESTAGAQPGERVGDASVLWELEEGLRRRSIPAAINRAPFYMSNWDEQLEDVRGSGKLATMLPANLKLPMAAPDDLGRIAADRLMSGLDDVGIRYIEGPSRYTPTDVAAAFAEVLERPVEVEVTPREQWRTAYRALGFSEPAADAYARMTGAALDRGFDNITDPLRGTITLVDYVRRLADRLKE